MLLQCEELRHIYYTVVFMYSKAQIPRGVKLLNNCMGLVNFFMGLSLTPPPNHLQREIGYQKRKSSRNCGGGDEKRGVSKSDRIGIASGSRERARARAIAVQSGKRKQNDVEGRTRTGDHTKSRGVTVAI